MLNRMLAIITALVIALLASAPMASASESDEWQFNIAPLYLWAVSLDGTMTVRDVEGDFTLDFQDAFSNIEMVFTVHFEAQKGNWAILADVSYLDLAGSQDHLLPNQTIDVELKNMILEGAGGYQFQPNWWALFGVRHYTLDPQITFPIRPTIDEKESWTDVFVGAMWRPRLGERWTFSGRFDLGTGDSDLVWNAAALVDYRIGKWAAVFVGYRHLDYDYKNSPEGFGYDVSSSGPLAALRFFW
jgi:hypothetical protein